MTAKLPSFQFYPGDWRKDPGVQALSFHDRGVWFELLLIMHESNDRGKLLLDGKAFPEDGLARLLGLDKQILTTTLTTLLTYGVASIDPETGALMNRRMVRDEESRKTQTNYGKKGGSPALCENYNKPGFVYLIQRASDGAVKIGISQNPTRRVYKLRYQNRETSLEIIGIFHVADMGKEEAELHGLFEHKANGEWFNLDQTELNTLLYTLKGKAKGKTPPSSSSSSSKNKEISKNIEISPPVAEKSPEEIKDKNKILKQEQQKIADEAIDMLNAVGKRSFRKSAKNRADVIARLNESFTLEDIKTVLDYKRTDSYFTIERPDLFRPETLFGTKFESYLQAARASPQGKTLTTAKQMSVWKPPEEREKDKPP